MGLGMGVVGVKGGGVTLLTPPISMFLFLFCFCFLVLVFGFRLNRFIVFIMGNNELYTLYVIKLKFR
jgi:hypothetical protein